MKHLFCSALFFLGVLTPASPVFAQTQKARAYLYPTNPVASLSGMATFEETPEGLKVSLRVVEAPPGRHGFHIHENGSCEEAGNAAGGHFNPDNVKHGDLSQEGFTGAHAGDFGNIEIGADGNGTAEKIFPGLTLKEGKYGVVGRSIILHEKEDDFGQPTGNAGGRIACGVIDWS